MDEILLLAKFEYHNCNNEALTYNNKKSKRTFLLHKENKKILKKGLEEIWIRIRISELSGHGAVWFSAFDWGSKGRWFESSCPDLNLAL